MGLSHHDTYIQQKNRYERLSVSIYLALVVINTGLICLLVFFYIRGPEKYRLGMDGLYEAICTSAFGLYVVFSFITGFSVLTTWLDVRRSNLVHAIIGKIDKGKGVGKEFYDPEAMDRDKFWQADDEKLVMRTIIPYEGLIIPVILLLIFLSIFFYHVWKDEVTDFDGIWICLAFLLFYSLVYNLFLRINYVEFNRMKGTVTVPAFLFPWYRTLSFERVKINAYDGKFRLVIPYRLLTINLPGDGESPQKWWSFYMWYMDKNRPLPPGNLLDGYREKDFLRRRQEGFPPPLYPSAIPVKDFDGNAKRYEVCDLKQLIPPDVPDGSDTGCVAYGTAKMDALNMGYQPQLTLLFCSQTELSALDISQCPKLIELECRDNELMILDISHNTLLKRLDCSGNPLEELRVWPGFDPEQLEQCYIPEGVTISQKTNPATYSA